MKKEERPTTARFDTDECKLLLMAMNYAIGRELFIHEGMTSVQTAGRIVSKLKHRIETERSKRDRVLASITVGGGSENGTGD